jgi:hypothetical protein
LSRRDLREGERERERERDAGREGVFQERGSMVEVSLSLRTCWRWSRR